MEETSFSENSCYSDAVKLRRRLTFQDQTDEHKQQGSRCNSFENLGSVRISKLAVTNVFDEQRGKWNEKEIPKTFQRLSPLQIQVLDGCWKGKIDAVTDAVLKAKETEGETYANVIINHCDLLGRTPIHFASAFGYYEIVWFLIHEGADVNVWDKQRELTPLGCACACGSSAVTQLLLAHNAEFNAGQWRCYTPLHWAVFNGSEECLRAVLNAKADPNPFCFGVTTPLHLAVARANPQCVKALIEHGANLEICTWGWFKWTALHKAVYERSPECVKLLLQAGAMTETLDGEMQTPLHVAVTNCDSQIINMLLTYNADPEAKDGNGRTALHKAVLVSKGDSATKCIRLLLTNSANINAQDNKGHTPLHIAAIYGLSCTMAFLLREGADVTIRAKTGQTALSMLVERMPHALQYIKECLDNSVTITTADPTDAQCVLELDFRVMIPSLSKHSTIANSLRAISPTTKIQRPIIDMHPETDFITCLIQNGCKSYLSHPLVESFIVLKWYRVRVFFWISFLFYTLLVLLYSVYVHEVFVQRCPFIIKDSIVNITIHSSDIVTSRKQYDKLNCQTLSTNLTETSSVIYCDLTDSVFLQIIWVLLTLIWAMNAIKEVFQLIQSFRVYFFIVEHYFCWLLLGSILVALWPIPFKGNCLTHWYYPSVAVGIIVAWSLMLVRIGRFPALGVYAQMLVKVVQNFSLFISAYACLIIAFAFAFTILFQDDKQFSSIPRSFLKTVTMMVGEFNYDELFYQKIKSYGIQFTTPRILAYPVTAHIVFGGFVFFMTIIVMNLLVGLAVHDIQSLEKGAKVEKLLRQTSSIVGLELFIFSKGLHSILPTSLGKFLRKRALLLPSRRCTFRFYPNGPHDRRLPTALFREALCLAGSRQKQPRDQNCAKPNEDHNTTPLQKQLEYMEMHLKECIKETCKKNLKTCIKETFKKDLENILTQISSRKSKRRRSLN